jgi:Protein of unknown function (DUF3096)
MDIEQELERTFKVPTAVLAFLAIVIGILVLFFPYILNILIAFFLVVWGLMKAFELGKRPTQETKDADTPKVSTPETQEIVRVEEDESSNLDPSDLSQAELSNPTRVPERPARRRKNASARRSI